MKSSRYNVLIELANGHQLAFNSVTAALAEIDSETLPRFLRLLRAPESAAGPVDSELLTQMSYARFLCGKDLDEIDEQRRRNESQRQTSTTFFLTIAPTLACNFRCDYCFQNGKSAVMSPKTADALLEFCQSRLGHSERFMITWFGGEPTVCPNLVCDLQRRFVDLCQQNGIREISSSVISNGYLLDGAMARRFKEAGITEAQITIDGPPTIHDRRRKLASGWGTFDRILANLEATCRILRVVVRINVDADNPQAPLDVIEILAGRGLLPHINIYFAPVNPAEGVCADVGGRCLSTEAFSKLQSRLYRELVQKGIRKIEYPMIAPGGYCGAGHADSYVVAPNGLLFKCWEEMSCDTAASIGSVFDAEPTPQQRENLNRYAQWDPFAKSECRECSILPLCLGGCPKAATAESNNDHGYCSPWKYNLGEMLTLRYLCNSNEEVEG